MRLLRIADERLRGDDLTNPLGGHVGKERGAVADGRRGGVLDGKAVDRGEPQSPQNPKRVLPEAGGRLPHRPDDPGEKIGLPPEGIAKPDPRSKGHGIDGEVPAGQIGRQIVHEGHAVGMAVVAVYPIGSKGGDLVDLAVHQHAQRPVF